eukprot:scaffold10636_cov43-Prasinocladus_malaysianus.AAC.1
MHSAIFRTRSHTDLSRLQLIGCASTIYRHLASPEQLCCEECLRVLVVRAEEVGPAGGWGEGEEEPLVPQPQGGPVADGVYLVANAFLELLRED